MNPSSDSCPHWKELYERRLVWIRRPARLKKRADRDYFFFAITEHTNEVAMLLIDQVDNVHINEEARTLID